MRSPPPRSPKRYLPAKKQKPRQWRHRFWTRYSWNPDGNAVLSGSGEPGSEISVLLDGEAVHRFTVDESGQFAEFVSIPFADDSRGLVLEAATGDKAARSDDYLIAALPAPVAAENVTEEPSVPVDEAETEVADAETGTCSCSRNTSASRH